MQHTTGHAIQYVFPNDYHGDHVDLFRYADDHVPQYIGNVAQKIIICKYTQLSKRPEITGATQKDVEKLSNFEIYFDEMPITIGKDIKITPYMVSHSACDAYMFLVEADGKRVLHTGDFRVHGHLANDLYGKIKHIGQIDVLITEGTMLSRTHVSG